jgi:hypothetical protein
MKGALRAGIIATVVVLLLAAALIVVAAIFNFLLDLLYITLIILAAFSLISTGFLIYTMLLLIQSIVTVRNEMKPLLASVQETVGIVKDTAKTAEHTASTIGSTAQLTKEFALAPSVRAVAAVVAVQQMVRVFTGKGRIRSRSEERRKRQMEAIAAGGE